MLGFNQTSQSRRSKLINWNADLFVWNVEHKKVRFLPTLSVDTLKWASYHSYVQKDMAAGSESSQDAGQSPMGGSEIGAVCSPNISTRERRKRLLSGVIMFVISVAILAALMAGGASRWWRLALFPLFAGAASGFFQWRDKT